MRMLLKASLTAQGFTIESANDGVHGAVVWLVWHLVQEFAVVEEGHHERGVGGARRVAVVLGARADARDAQELEQPGERFALALLGRFTRSYPLLVGAMPGPVSTTSIATPSSAAAPIATETSGLEVAKAAIVKRVARADTTYLVTNMMRSVLSEGTGAAVRASAG